MCFSNYICNIRLENPLKRTENTWRKAPEILCFFARTGTGRSFIAGGGGKMLRILMGFQQRARTSGSFAENGAAL